MAHAGQVLLLLPLVAGSLRLTPLETTASRLLPIATEAKNVSSSVAREVDEIHSLVSSFRKIENELLADQGDTDPERKAARQRLLERAKGEVEDVLPHEVQRLESVFAAGKPKRTKRAKGHSKKGKAKKISAKIGKNRKWSSKDASECHEHIPASDMGLKTGRKAARFFGKAFLQLGEEPAEGEEEPYVSSAVPGSGSNQTMKDEGRSIMGSMKGEEPLVTVYKDGYWMVGCFNDVMLVNYDKFGDNKFKYSEDAKYADVSVAVYKELVLADFQKPMQARICFEFCRTLDNMQFFGLQGGRTCYCMPYYKSSAGGEGDTCDLPCEGNDMEMCGGKTKSTVFEMHTCGDKEAQLTDKAVGAGEALSAFYAAALVSSTVAQDIQATATIFQAVAGQAGDPDTADMAQEAKVGAGKVANVLADGECMDAYNLLLTTYEEAESISLLNLKQAANLQKANDAAMVMDEQIPKVDACSKKAGLPALYYETIDAESDVAYKANQERYGAAIGQYHPLMYVLKNNDKPKPTTCTGEVLGTAAAANLAECAQACDDMVFPDKCAAYQFFHVSGTTSTTGNLCYLFKSVKTMTVYTCPMTSALVDGEKDRVKAASGKAEFLLQSPASRTMFLQNADEPEEQDEAEEKIMKIDESMCDNVLQALSYSAMTCEETFGSEASVKDTCSAVCERTRAPRYAAVCMSKLSEISGATPGLEIKEKDRCFAGAKNEEVDGPKPGPLLIPVDDNGAVLAGDAKIGAQVVLEPVMWTESKDEE